MGLFSTRCDICFNEKKFVSKNNRGVKICRDCKKNALKNMSSSYLPNANICELSYAARNGSLNASLSYCESKGMNATDSLKQVSPEPSDVGISLAKDEICFYKGKARSKKTKNIITRYNRQSIGFSIRLMKGVSVRPGTGVSTPVREDVTETYEGDLYITNKRLILLAPKYGFDVQRTKISTIEPFRNGFRLYVGEKNYDVITFDMNTITSIINLSNRYLEENSDSEKDYDNAEKIEKNEAKEEIQEKDRYEELRDYKKLLDEGAITKEEFDVIKNKLLG